jgi:eukaryotic-like serine/threonine-protein kinase
VTGGLTSRAACAAGRAERTQIDVERAVRNQLYGERSELTVAPLARTAVAATQLLGGRYRLLSLLGAGGMTNVYCARDELLKRRVAVKVLAEPLASDPRCLRQFRREAELWAGLAHPLIVAVFDAGAVPRPFIVMELVPGMSAVALARGPRPPTCDRAIRIVAQVAEALAFAHEHNVVHRDVSPGNVVIRRSDRAAKLTDFGLACRAGEEAPKYCGDVAGTYGYMAPEVLRGETVSPLSDLYSLGALAYRLLAGPPERRSATAAKLPTGVTDVVDRALEPDPDARQSSVAEFRAQLLAAHGSPGLAQSRAA